MAQERHGAEVGTEELEKGLLPSPASDFARIAIVAVAMLLAFNSAALVEWTRQPRPGPVIAALEAPAVRWHEYMVEIGTVSLMKRLRDVAR
jgi:hypothetical protein